MKITDLSERVQAFQAIHEEKDDGEFTINYQPTGWLWAQITPQCYITKEAKNQAETYQNRYKIVMRKNDIYNTRHAYITRLRWNHKLLDIYTPWIETQCVGYISGIAITKNVERIHG